jgi:tight adherence protein B
MNQINDVLNSNPALLIILVVIFFLLLILRNEKTKVSKKLADAIIFSEDTEEVIVLTPGQQKQQALNKKLEKAGLPLAAHEFTLIKYILTLVVFLLTYIVLKNPLVSGILSIMIFFVPPIAVNFAINKKRDKFESQLPGALSLLRNSVEAGMSFLQSMELVANEMDPPISDEFSKVIHESQVGIDLKTSFHRMLERVDSTELKLMTIAVLIQREVGGNLSEILDIILETIRERIQLKGEIKAITAQGRASAALIGALPPLLLVVMNFINPDYMSPLFTTFLGQGILAGCFMMECIGIYMIMQIIKVDF